MSKPSNVADTRRLILIRHAKSSWDAHDLTDFDRPLNVRGQRDAPIMARRLATEFDREQSSPPRLISSPALRALTTAQIFADALGVPKSQISLEPQIYEATPGTLLELIRKLPDSDRMVLMFGHNPGFSDFARLLAECPFVEMPTCAIATIAFVDLRWHELNPDCGRLERYRFPKDSD